MAFDRTVALGQSQCRFHGMLIAQEPGCEAAEGGNRLLLDSHRHHDRVYERVTRFISRSLTLLSIGTAPSKQKTFNSSH
jgi:hypothetical protein